MPASGQQAIASGAGTTHVMNEVATDLPLKMQGGIDKSKRAQLTYFSISLSFTLGSRTAALSM
jgi:hypothetical protein